jgi:hypothetical protein
MKYNPDPNKRTPQECLPDDKLKSLISPPYPEELRDTSKLKKALWRHKPTGVVFQYIMKPTQGGPNYFVKYEVADRYLVNPDPSTMEPMGLF